MRQKGEVMGGYDRNNRCPESDGTYGNHYLGCSFEGRKNGAGFGGSDFGKFLIFGSC